MKTATTSKINRLIVAFLWTFLWGAPLWAGTTYYVDFDSGSNTNAGTQAAPWKHAPGDPNATNDPKNVALQPGDTVLFKGGVTYRGSINITAQGTEANPITYKGDGWGTSKAIIDGSDPFNATWTRCTSAADCGGNPNWANIWYTTAPANFNSFCPVYEDGAFLWFAQDPNPTDPIFYDRVQEFREVPLNDPNRVITRTTIKDTSYFTQDDASYWNGSYVLVYYGSNIVAAVPVTSFDPQTNTITFEDVGDAVYTNPGRYAMVGHSSLIDMPGEVGLYEGKIFIWPKNSDIPNNHLYSISKRKSCISLKGSYLTVEGFLVRGSHGLIKEYGNGSAINAYNTVSNAIIRNNEVTALRSLARAGSIVTDMSSNVRIENNYVHHCQKSNGILCSGNGIYCDNNRVEYVGYVGIWFMHATNSRITGNLIENTNGTHANGVSVYEYSNNILVARNRIIVGPNNNPYTLQRSENVHTIGNLIDGKGGSSFSDWGRMTGTNYVLNNTLINGVYVGSSPDTFVFRNNIIGGGIISDRDYNLYIALSWNQEERYGWYPNTHETINTDTGNIFMGFANGDFRLKTNSPAIGKGTDVSAYYPVGLFPDFDFSVDIDGKPHHDRWDIGAYVPVIDSDTEAPVAPSGLKGEITQ